MTIKTERFARRPFFIDAVQVTAENMHDVAKWCDGEVRTTVRTPDGPDESYVKVRVHRPLNDRQTQAFISDWLLYAGSGYKVYTIKAFTKNFEPIAATDTQTLVQLDEGQSVELLTVAKKAAPAVKKVIPKKK